jgi:hypothetical protein
MPQSAVIAWKLNLKTSAGPVNQDLGVQFFGGVKRPNSISRVELVHQLALILYLAKFPTRLLAN